MSRLDDFKSAFESADLDALVAHFAPGAVLHSPFLTKPFEGREAIRGVLGVILEVLQDPTYAGELTGDGSAALVVKARVRGHDIDVVDLIRFDGGGQIADFTVFVRPRKASEALFSEVARRIAPSADSAA